MLANKDNFMMSKNFSINLNAQLVNEMTHFDLEKLVRLYDTLGRT